MYVEIEYEDIFFGVPDWRIKILFTWEENPVWIVKLNIGSCYSTIIVEDKARKE